MWALLLGTIKTGDVWEWRMRGWGKVALWGQKSQRSLLRNSNVVIDILWGHILFTWGRRVTQWEECFRKIIVYQWFGLQGTLSVGHLSVTVSPSICSRAMDSTICYATCGWGISLEIRSVRRSLCGVWTCGRWGLTEGDRRRSRMLDQWTLENENIDLWDLIDKVSAVQKWPREIRSSERVGKKKPETARC